MIAAALRVGIQRGGIRPPGCRRPQLGWACAAQDAQREGRGLGSGTAVHQLSHPAGPEAAQVGRRAGKCGDGCYSGGRGGPWVQGQALLGERPAWRRAWQCWGSARGRAAAG